MSPHGFRSSLRVIAIAGTAATIALSSLALGKENVVSPLLAIDKNRTTVVDRIVRQWGGTIERAEGGITADQLRELLLGMRSDQLLAASLAGTADGLRNVVAASLVSEQQIRASLVQSKAIGDATQDIVYVPVTPCRLVETRGTFPAVYQGGGAFATNEIRTYTLQGGNGVCLSQLPASVNPSAVQLQVYGIPTTSGSGDIEILPQGAAFGSTATLVYLGNNAFTSSAATSPVNTANKQISVQVRGPGAHLAVDVVGYFRTPPSINMTYTATTGSAIFVNATNAANAAAAVEAHQAGSASAVYGLNTAVVGSTTGVLGEASSTSHGVGPTGGVSGIVGRVTPTTPGGYSAGVRGVNNGTTGTGIGVIGYQAGSGWGVYGETPNGFGVYGLTTNNAAASVGVRGETFSTNGIGVEAKYSGTGIGVALQLDNGAIQVSGVNRAAFIHTATPASKLSANGTDVDNPMSNGDANAILIVTQKLNPSGIVYNNSPIGVYYNTVRNKWEIFNQNNVAIPDNAQFNVLVIKR